MGKGIPKRDPTQPQLMRGYSTGAYKAGLEALLDVADTRARSLILSTVVKERERIEAEKLTNWQKKNRQAA